MRRHIGTLICILAVALQSGISFADEREQMDATTFEWPDLPTTGFVSGRPTTLEDVEAGNAIFVIGDDNSPGGTALELDVPQYAYHIDQETKQKTPTIILQAEESNGINAIGYIDLIQNSAGVALLEEFVLLGTDNPTEDEGT